MPSEPGPEGQGPCQFKTITRHHPAHQTKHTIPRKLGRSRVRILSWSLKVNRRPVSRWHASGCSSRRLYLGLLQTITDDYGGEFVAHSDSIVYRTIGIYVFLRTVTCSPVRASQIAHALKLPRVAVLRRLQELVKHGYVERVGNAYRVTDKVNIPDLQSKMQRRIDMVTETAKRLSELSALRPS